MTTVEKVARAICEVGTLRGVCEQCDKLNSQYCQVDYHLHEAQAAIDAHESELRKALEIIKRDAAEPPCIDILDCIVTIAEQALGKGG